MEERGEREKSVLRTMQRFFYDETENEGKGEEDDCRRRRFHSQREQNHKSRPPYDHGRADEQRLASNSLLTYSP